MARARAAEIRDRRPVAALPRLGFKGPRHDRRRCRATRAAASVEATPNRAFRQADGGLCLVLAPGEVYPVWPISAGDGERPSHAMERDWRHRGRRSAPIRMPRRDSHAWFW